MVEASFSKGIKEDLMAEFVRTEVFATEAEAQEISDLAATAQATPVMAVSSAHGLDRGGFAGDAWRRVNETIYGYALAHGLPEVQGYYGFDPSNAEFLDVGEV